MSAGRFLLATIDGGGTLPPEMGLTAELIRRGHSVHVLADPTVRDSALVAGCGFTPWPTAPSVGSDAEQTAMVKRMEQGAPWRRFAAVRDLMLAGPAGRFADDVVATARVERADVLLTEGVPGILLGALATDRPVAALMPNIYLRPSKGFPPMGTGWLPGRNPLTRARNTLAGKGITRVMKTCVPPINDAAAMHGVPAIGGVFELFDRCDRVLVMTSRSFDFVPDVLPMNVRYTGPQLDDPAWASSTGPGGDWRPPGDAPLVLVSMSSVFQDQLEVLRRAARALGTLPVRGVITTGRAVDPVEVSAPENVRVLRAVPHAPILAEAAVVVTHAGHGTVIKALAAGVPLVCLPQGRDQRDNTARVQRLGAGIRLGKRATSAAIAGAIREVLDNDHYRAAAAAFAGRLAVEVKNTPSAADEAETLLTIS
jgi:UDP:flavonoid glycosyltransferase YjiC (YdhE family)